MLVPIGRSGWAIAAVYLGLVSVLLILDPLAIVTAVLAFSDIRRSRTETRPRRGTGRAVFGLIMGIVGTAMLIFMIVAARFDSP